MKHFVAATASMALSTAKRDQVCSRSAARSASAIAFPCIATGVYEYPRDKASEVTIAAVRKWLESHELPREVIFCCFNDADAELYREKLSALDSTA
jgi:O-acetyl-ADP-ribose deacetylase